MTTAAPVLLYAASGCPYCEAKRRELAARGLAWREVNVSDHPEAIAELLKLTGGRRIVPVLVDGARIEVAAGGGSAF